MSDSLILMWLINPEAAYIYVCIVVVFYIGLTAWHHIKKRRELR
jgi:hypothetical protein